MKDLVISIKDKLQKLLFVLDELKRDLDSLDVMEDLFNVRSQFGEEFGFDTSNEISKQHISYDTIYELSYI